MMDQQQGKLIGRAAGRSFFMAFILAGGTIMLNSQAFGAEEKTTPIEQGGFNHSIKVLKDGFWDRIHTAKKPIKEPPDAPLVPKSGAVWTRYLHALLNAPTWLDFAASYRIRWEGLDHPFKAGSSTDIREWSHRTRFLIGADWKMFRFFVEFQDSGSSNAFDSSVILTEPFSENSLQQGFVSIPLPNTLGTGIRLDGHIGRLSLDFGSRRLIARNRFSNTSNAFDGIHLTVSPNTFWQMRTFLVLPTTRTVEGLTSSFASGDSFFWGLYFETQRSQGLNTNVYYFGLNDKPPMVSAQRNYSTVGARLFEPPHVKALDYEIESIWQVGTMANLDHFAHFQHGEVGYTFDAPWTPRVLAQFDYASGTANPEGTYSQTFDSLFGARRFELIPTGTYGPFRRSNIISPGIRLIVQPWSTLKANLKFRAWYLAQSRDAWAGSGIQDLTGNSGQELGRDLEVRIQWNPFLNLHLEAGYDHFFKGSFIENQAKIPGNPPATDTDYFYFQTEIRL